MIKTLTYLRNLFKCVLVCRGAEDRATFLQLKSELVQCFFTDLSHIYGKLQQSIFDT